MVSYAPLFVNINDRRYAFQPFLFEISFCLIVLGTYMITSTLTITLFIYSTDWKLLISFRWSPDAIVFNSSHMYATPSYWVQCFFTESSGASIYDTKLQTNYSASLIASAISWKNSKDDKNYLRIKV